MDSADDEEATRGRETTRTQASHEASQPRPTPTSWCQPRQVDSEDESMYRDKTFPQYQPGIDLTAQETSRRVDLSNGS